MQVDQRRAAIIVIDMQNCFVSKGGMLDLSGADIRPHAKVVKLIAEINHAARTTGVKVVYVAHIYSPDFRDIGGPDSPNPRKEHALRLWETHPEWRDRLLVRGTWGAQIVDKLKPQKGTYSLRSAGIMLSSGRIWILFCEPMASNFWYLWG